MFNPDVSCRSGKSNLSKFYRLSIEISLKTIYLDGTPGVDLPAGQRISASIRFIRQKYILFLLDNYHYGDTIFA